LYTEKKKKERQEEAALQIESEKKTAGIGESECRQASVAAVQVQARQCSRQYVMQWRYYVCRGA